MNKIKIVFGVLILSLAIQSKAQVNTLPTTGNVGIGTLTPSAELEVTGDIKFTGINDPNLNPSELRFLMIDKDGALIAGDKVIKSAAVAAGNNGKGNGKGNAIPGGGGLCTGSVITWKNDNGFSYLCNDDNVGIGTYIPSEKFTVNGIIYSMNGGVKFPDGTTQQVAYDPSQIYLAGTDLIFPHSPAAATVDLSGLTGGGGGASYWNQLSGNTTPNKHIYYRTDVGNVGVGDIDPSEALSVGGNIKLNTPILGTEGGYSGKLMFENETGTDGDVWISRFFRDFGASDLRVNIGAGTTNKFVIGSGSSFYNRFFVESDGDVGIGNIQIPTGYKLAIDGKVICEEVKVELSQNWPDYVFSEDYKLKDLNQVEKYINENNHLPGVPSASDVEEEGIELGEMNRVLLEKVEELTLYMIEMEKKNKELEERLIEVEKK